MLPLDAVEVEAELVKIDTQRGLVDSLERGILTAGEVAAAFADRLVVGYLRGSGRLSLEDAIALAAEVAQDVSALAWRYQRGRKDGRSA